MEHLGYYFEGSNDAWRDVCPHYTWQRQDDGLSWNR